MIQLETERLLLRRFTVDDVEAVFKMRSDADVMRFIRAPQKNRGEAESWIDLVSSRWESDRIGFCAVIEKASNRFVGWCGLWRLKETGETEVGYALVRDFRGQGIASEAAEAFLVYGFEILKLEEIVAVARPENRASRAVMERIGMSYDYTGTFYDNELVHYSITKKEFSEREKEQQSVAG